MKPILILLLSFLSAAATSAQTGPSQRLNDSAKQVAENNLEAEPLTPVEGQRLRYRTVQPFVTGIFGLLDNLGYRNPSPSGGAGIDIETGALYLTAELSEAWTRKIETGDGHSWSGDAAIYWRDGGLLLGAGTRYSSLTTSQWTKHSNRPLAGFGYEGRTYRLLCNYLTPLGDPQNRLQGPLMSGEFAASDHWRLRMTFGFYRYWDTRVPGVTYAAPAQAHTAAESDLGLKYEF
jgi:hypothetical protein